MIARRWSHLNSTRCFTKVTGKQFLLFGFLLIAFFLLNGYLYYSFLDISTIQNVEDSSLKPPSRHLKRPPLYFGVISRYSPREIYEGYQPIMEYLTHATPYTFELKLSDSYEETIAQLATNAVQFAFLGDFIYARAYKSLRLPCILKPFNQNGEAHFHAVLITREDSEIRSIADLRNKRIALPSTQSFTGNWVPYILKKSDIWPSVKNRLHHFRYHSTVVQKILQGEYDAGGVKQIVAEKYKKQGLRVIFQSDPIPTSPIVASRQCPLAVVQAVKQALLKINVQQPLYRQLVRNWDPEFRYGFTPAQADDYLKNALIVQVLKGAASQ